MPHLSICSSWAVVMFVSQSFTIFSLLSARAAVCGGTLEMLTWPMLSMSRWVPALISWNMASTCPAVSLAL